MTETGSRIVQAIEAAWKDIQANHAEIPDVVAITGSGLHQKGSAKWAHFWAKRWLHTTKDTDGSGNADRRPELFVAGQLLALPGRRIMQTLIHEAAHSLNFVRGRQDCNVNGRHNKRDFVAAAVELGLIWPEGKEPHPTIGYSQVEITDETAEKYKDTIAALEAAHLAYLDDMAQTGGETGGTTGGTTGGGTTPGRGKGGRGGTRGGKRINVVCECEDPDPFPISPGRLARKPIKCGDCDALYRPQDPDDQDEQDQAA